MIVLSLFDGISCGQVALQRANIPVSVYFASEIDKYAIQITQKNFPNTIQLGDVKNIDFSKFTGGVDLLLAGSPCQGFSRIGKELNFEDERSRLFFKFVEALKTIKPKYFLLENVKMKKEYQDIITHCVGVEPILINSSLVSYQNRERLYWSNIPNITQPEDKHINFQDYKCKNTEICKQYKVKRTKSREKMWNNGLGKNSISSCPNITYSEKIMCLTLKQDRAPNSGLIEFEDFCRYLTRDEIEMAQNLPLGYTDGLTYNQMQKVCGNGWTVDVIAHILRQMP